MEKIAKPHIKVGTVRKPSILEPHADQIFSLYYQAFSMREIVDWLSEPPRNIVIGRAGVFKWVKHRLAKAARRLAEVGARFEINKRHLSQPGVSVAETDSPGDPPPSASTALAVEQPPIAQTLTESVSLREPWIPNKKPKVDMSKHINRSMERPLGGLLASKRP